MDDTSFDWFTPFVKLRVVLKKPLMKPGEVTKILRITHRQLYYWDKREASAGGLLVARNRSWRKFSILDVFGFAIIKKLLQQGIKVEKYEKVFYWVYQHIVERPFFLYHFAEGDPVFFLMDLSTKEIKHYYGSNMEELNGKLKESSRAHVVIPVSPLLQQILLKRPDPWFQINLIEDRFGTKNKVLFLFLDEDIETEGTEEDRESYDPTFELEESAVALAGLNEKETRGQRIRRFKRKWKLSKNNE